jgi:hypothetical protein
LASSEQIIRGDAAGDREALRRLLDDTRRRLVETGTRNRLVHVNRSNVRGNFLHIVNGRSDGIYSILSDHKTMRFRALGTDGDDLGETLRQSAPNTEKEYISHSTDGDLETRLGPDALQKKLLKIAREAQTAEEEQGVNILYLALGFLAWFEDKASSVPREAPLLLLPVQLIRNQRTSTYDVRIRDEDVSTNLPLQQRLKDDFGIHLPEIEADDGWQPAHYFDQVAAVIGSQQRWSIDRDGIQLGFFSFAKFLMFRDLAPTSWPEGALEDHPLARGLLFEGFEPEPPLFGPEDQLDVVLPPSQLFHVVDADSSQARVIEEVRAGRNLVVQGPPGTGKSQTITNIIAAAAREGKQVLFVAEKMAALTVVHDRLVKVGLKDICLELHSKSANKKSVLAELARTLGAARAIPSRSDDVIALTAARDQLNAIVRALHAPIGASGETAFSVLARQARYLGAGVAPPSLGTDELAALTISDERRLCEAIESYGTLLTHLGPPDRHPLRGVRRTDLQPVDLNRLSGILAQAQERTTTLCAAINAAIAATGIDLQPSLVVIAPLLDLFDRLAGLPSGRGSLASQIMGAPDKVRLAGVLTEASAWREARNTLAEVFVEDAFSTSLSALRAPIVAGETSFFSRLGSKYRKASRELAGLLRGTLPKTASERLVLLNRLAAVQEMRARWGEDETYCASVLGVFWRGERSDFDDARAVADWCRKVDEAKLGVAPARAINLATKGDELAIYAHALRQAEPAARETLGHVTQLLALDPTTVEAVSIEEADLRKVAARLEIIGNAIDHYGEWARLNHLRAQIQVIDSGQLAGRMDNGELDGIRAAMELRFARAERLWHDAIVASPELGEIRSIDRHELVARFTHLDREQLKDNVDAIRAHHLAQVPQGAMGEMRVIRGEIGKRRSHIALRKLFSSAPNAIQRIKPVLLMSPISVAQFLPPDVLTFDLLVIDEASQVRPEDALGAIVRARQIVVVGDQKQLPPTSFFDRLVVDEDEDVSEEEERVSQPDLLGGAAKLGTLESILSLCEARGLNSRMLQWHYRSRDPSLIRMSNREFYGDGLVLPPSPFQNDPTYGLCFTHVDGVYDRGGRRDNRKEGAAVVQRVAQHARENASLSLGIATLSFAQRNLITELLEVARRNDPVLDSFLREGGTEDVFVKNLENVQGDERDVILVSVGYGPSVPGGRLGSMSFGPVNGDGGERRLNVLFTRARVRCEIFASFDPGDIDLSRVSREGPRILKRFLEFAKSGLLDEPLVTGEMPDSPFEEDVADNIRSLGFLVDPQVGSAGFRIDLGIRHPERPGTYILAVECDGATYHSALWARERDRLRQDVLEHLGWRFHRIWSTDWFYNRRAEVNRLHEALIAARAASEAGIRVVGANHQRPITPSATDEVPIPEIPEVVDRQMPPYVRAVFTVHSAAEPHEASRTMLAQLAIRIIEAEGPIHVEEIARRIAASFGRDRAGSRIISATKLALTYAQRISSDLITEESFWFTRRQSETPPVRDRSTEEGATLKASSISLLEIKAALQIAHDDNAGGDDAELIRTAARLLGFRRVGSDLQARLVQGLEHTRARCPPPA